MRVTVKYGSYRPACLRVVARDAQGHEVGTNLLQSEFKDPEARRVQVAVLRQPEWSRELTLEVSSFAGSTGEACSGALVETHSTPSPILVPQRDFASFEVTLRAKDDDGDSFIAREEGVAGTDCDDGRGEVFPGAVERCSVEVDYDCNGVKGCQDSRCQQSACDDGNACTTGERCEGSGPSAQCKGQPVQCDKPAGACSLGATCSQETGQCVVTRKQCAAPANTCLEAGVCNEATGNCDYAPKQASVSCDDGQACTTGDACNGAGVCQGTQTPCTPSSICFRVTGCAALGNCTEEPDPSKVNAACRLAGGTGSGVCRATDGKCSRFPYIPSNFDPDAIPTASIIPLNSTCDVTFDSTTLSWTPATCVSNPPTPIELSQGSGMVLFALSNLNLGGNLRLEGNRPVILAVYGDATLNYNILANAQGTVPGAGGSLESACTDRRGRGGAFSSDSTGGGGGGAGGGTVGGVGGNGTGSGAMRGDGGNSGGMSSSPSWEAVREGAEEGAGERRRRAAWVGREAEPCNCPWRAPSRSTNGSPPARGRARRAVQQLQRGSGRRGWRRRQWRAGIARGLSAESRRLEPTDCEWRRGWGGQWLLLQRPAQWRCGGGWSRGFGEQGRWWVWGFPGRWRWRIRGLSQRTSWCWQPGHGDLQWCQGRRRRRWRCRGPHPAEVRAALLHQRRRHHQPGDRHELPAVVRLWACALVTRCPSHEASHSVRGGSTCRVSVIGPISP
ncbi:putative metal-binding motif-containing protein [Cystobacter fuscus]